MKTLFMAAILLACTFASYSQKSSDISLPYKVGDTIVTGNAPLDEFYYDDSATLKYIVDSMMPFTSFPVSVKRNAFVTDSKTVKFPTQITLRKAYGQTDDYNGKLRSEGNRWDILHINQWGVTKDAFYALFWEPATNAAGTDFIEGGHQGTLWMFHKNQMLGFTIVVRKGIVTAIQRNPLEDWPMAKISKK